MLPTLPKTIETEEYEETVDTQENRFVKYALTTFRGFFESIESAIQTEPAAKRQALMRELVPCVEKLNEVLDADLFREVSDLELLPASSLVLQRRAGYREVFEAWIKFNAASRLIWRGGDDVFSGGRKDVALLYEYWLFFVLWQILCDWSPEAKRTLPTTLLEPTADGFGLKLRSGELLESDGIPISRNGTHFRLQFSYNKTFEISGIQFSERRLKYIESYPMGAVWTRRMRPDFTLSFWNEGVDRRWAEEHEQVVHLHMDSKYSVVDLARLFGAEREDLGELKKQERSGTYRRAELLKMHAYHDAIRRSQGAYILYPGILESNCDSDPEYHVWLGFNEILPGLGAFVVRPGSSKEKSAALLRKFLEDVLDHIAAGETRRERVSAYIAAVYGNEH
jgi:predicted component of viral defense system (DUF524 family)